MTSDTPQAEIAPPPKKPVVTQEPPTQKTTPQSSSTTRPPDQAAAQTTTSKTGSAEKASSPTGPTEKKAVPKVAFTRTSQKPAPNRLFVHQPSSQKKPHTSWFNRIPKRRGLTLHLGAGLGAAFGVHEVSNSYTAAGRSAQDQRSISGKSYRLAAIAEGRIWLQTYYLFFKTKLAYQGLESGYRETLVRFSDHRFSAKNTLAIHLLPGVGFVLAPDVNVFLAAGMAWGHWTVSSNNAVVRNQHVEQKFMQKGFTAEIGLESRFEKHKRWFWGVDFGYTHYQKLVLDNATTIAKITTRPSVLTILFSLKKRFGTLKSQAS